MNLRHYILVVFKEIWDMDGRLNAVPLEWMFCESYDEALERKRRNLATYLVGYGVIWDDIDEKEHERQLLDLSLVDLEQMANEAYCNKELDYRVEIFEKL